MSIQRSKSGQSNRDQGANQWQRMFLAGAAVLLVVVGVATHLLPGIEPGSARFISGTAWKVAFVMLIAWLASPQLERLGWERIRGTMLTAVIIVIILYAIRPRIGAIAALILFLGSGLVAIGGWVRRLSGRSV
jgi:hypothetical protein